jgi:hypothetical protein
MCIELSAASALAKSFSESFRPPEGVAVPLMADPSESDRFLGFITYRISIRIQWRKG